MTNRLELELLRHEITQTTQHFSRKSGKVIRVAFGLDAATDCDSIVTLPAIDESKLTPEMTRAFRGYVDHEAGGHMVFTDKSVLDAMKDKPTLKGYWNGLEDPRIERLHIEQFPGALKNIRTAVSVVTREHTLKALRQDPPAAHNIVEYAPVVASLVGRRLYGLTTPESDEAIAMFPPKIVVAIEAFARRALYAANSGEVMAIADEMMQAMLAEEKAQQQQQQKRKGKANGKRVASQGQAGEGNDPNAAGSGSGTGAASPEAGGQDRAGGGAGAPDDQDDEGTGTGTDAEDDEEDDDQEEGKGGDGEDEDGEDGDEEDEGAGEGGEDDGQDEDGEGDDESDQGVHSEGGQAGDSGAGAQPGGGAGGAARKILDPSLSQILQHVAQQGPKVVQIEPPAHLWEITRERKAPRKDLLTHKQWEMWTTSGRTLGRKGFQAHLSKVPAAAANMTKTLLRVLAARQRRDRDRGLAEGRLDPRRLVQAAMGETNVFYKPADRTDMDTFVEVLVDCSSSMWSTRALLATSLAAMGSALEATGVTWACHTYGAIGDDGGTSGGALSPYKVQGDNAYGAARAKAEGVYTEERKKNPSVTVRLDEFIVLSMFELKGATERLMATAHRFAAIDALIAGGTPTGRGMLQVLPLMLARPENRKVMVVLTDGSPNSDDPFHSVVRSFESRGVTVIGIGIGHNAKTDGFPAAEIIGSLDALAKTTLQAIWKDLA